MNSVSMAVGYGDVILQAVLIVLLLLASNYRRYPLLLLYCVIQFVTSCIEGWVFMHGVNTQSSQWGRLYWRNEVVVDSLLFFLVIVLTSQAMEGSALRSKTHRLLGIITVVVMALPLVIFPNRFGTRWFYSTSQLLNFGAAILNLALWGALIANRKRDPRLLAVSAGLGIAVTGAAISYGLGQFFTSETARDLVDLFKSTTHLACMVTWCWAFLPNFKRSTPAAQTVPSP